MSNLSAIPYLPETPSQATPGLWNRSFSQISSNLAALNSDLTQSLPSGQTFSFLTNIETSGGAHFQHLSIGSTPPSYVTTAAVTIEVNSAYSDYLYFVDSSAQKSSYVIGSRAGGLSDGLNIWDASAGTLIASFSKQSIRFFQNVVGPVFDLGGALSATYNAATFGTGADSIASRIQSAINQASIDNFKYVYLPASMLSFSASSISFIYSLRMVREGGSWDVFDVQAYGAHGNGAWEDTTAFQQALYSAGPGDVVYASPTTRGYVVGASSLSVPTGVRLSGGNFGLQGGRFTNNVGLGASSVPGGTMLVITDTTHVPIQLADSATVQGMTFWYPQQNWNITNTESFTSYPDSVRLGITNGAVSNAQVADCLFIGASVAISQSTTTGPSAVNRLHVENCSGTVMGPFLRLYVVSDPVRVRNVQMSPAFAVSYAVDGAIGGNAKVFNTKVAQCSKLAELGEVDDFEAVNCYALATKHFVHYPSAFYTNDVNQKGGGRFVNCVADVTESMFYLQRGSNTAGLLLSNCWVTPVFRSSGNTGSDVTNQGLIRFESGSSISDIRVSLDNVRLFGGTTIASNYSGGFIGNPRYAFIANGTVGANFNVLATNCHFSSLSSGVVDSNLSAVVMLGAYTQESVPQHYNHLRDLIAGYSTATDRNVEVISAPGNTRDLRFRSGTSLRWALRANNTAEGGADTGSDLRLVAHSDLGAEIDNVLAIPRVASGTVVVNRPIDFTQYQIFRQFSEFADGTISSPSIIFLNEGNLGFYRSGRSHIGLSYGGLSHPDGSSSTPSIAFSSNTSLGFYSSGVQTIAPSYGTFNLATNAVRFSMRTLAASSLTPSAANTNVATNEVVFTVGGASGASFAISSGGTTYIFNSDASAKNT